MFTIDLCLIRLVTTEVPSGKINAFNWKRFIWQYRKFRYLLGEIHLPGLQLLHIGMTLTFWPWRLTPSSDPECEGHRCEGNGAYDHQGYDGEESQDEDSCSEHSSSTSTSTNQKEGKYCDCCYCEFFGHGGVRHARTRIYSCTNMSILLCINLQKSQKQNSVIVFSDIDWHYVEYNI